MWFDTAPKLPSQVRGVGQPEVQPAPAVPRVKLVLLGDSVRLVATLICCTILLPCYKHTCVQGVGKSCLVLRYVRGQFDPTSKVTVGAAFMSHSVHLPDGTTIKFEIW